MPKIPIKAKPTQIKLATSPSKKPITAIKRPESQLSQSKSLIKTTKKAIPAIPKKIVQKAETKEDSKQDEKSKMMVDVIKKALAHNKPHPDAAETPINDDSKPVVEKSEEDLSQKEVKSALQTNEDAIAYSINQSEGQEEKTKEVKAKSPAKPIVASKAPAKPIAIPKIKAKDNSKII